MTQYLNPVNCIQNLTQHLHCSLTLAVLTLIGSLALAF